MGCRVECLEVSLTMTTTTTTTSTIHIISTIITTAVAVCTISCTQYHITTNASVKASIGMMRRTIQAFRFPDSGSKNWPLVS